MFSLFNFLSGFATRKRTIRKVASGNVRLNVETLEDRLTPSGTPLDLTTHGAIGSIEGAIFQQYDAQPTGTGVINSFVRIQGNKAAEQQGYNTDYRKVQFDENTSPQFTRSLQLSSVPTVNIGGVIYREFLLDINQKASSPLLSLDELRFYVGNAGNLIGYSAGNLSGATKVYDLDANGDNWVKVNARLNQGSGKGDVLVYVPNSLFTGGSYVYLYSKFGTNIACNGGFEEWAAGKDSIAQDNGSISGHVYLSGTTTGIADVVVFIDANHNGVRDTNEDYTFTASDGSYLFNFLATNMGSYSVYDVTEEVPAGYTIASASSVDVSLQQTNQQATGIDFFLTQQEVQTYAIGGSVLDQTGTNNATWTVTLTDNTTGETTTISGTGSDSYSFTGLTAGHDYTVTATTDAPNAVIPPTTYTITNLVSNVSGEDFSIRSTAPPPPV